MTEPRRRSLGLATWLLSGLVLLVVMAGLAIAFVPVIYPPKPPWPTFCDFGDIPERISLLEFWNRSRRTR
jgi:hypothetical protein